MNSMQRRTIPKLFLSLALGLMTLMLCLVPSTAQAQSTFTVTSLADNGAVGTLRDAINQANAQPGSTIKFSVTGTITLTSSLPEITAGMTIQGPTGSPLAIDGAHSYKVMLLTASDTVTLSNLTIQNGATPSGDGDGANTHGGGVSARGSSTVINNCTFSGNYAQFGGGLSCYPGNVVISGCTFVGNSSGNWGSGALETYGTVTITNCTMTGNTCSGWIGAGAIMIGGSTSMTNCTISNNSGPTSAIWCFQGTATLTNCIAYGDGTEVGYYSGNLNASYSDIQGGYGGTANFDTDPKLGPLASNGGPTQTMALLTGSPCYGAGTTNGAPITDQRGYTRPNPPGIGAYDYPAAPVLTGITLSPTSVTGGSSSTGTVTISGPAPTGGDVISLTSGSSSAVPPSSVTITAGSTSATFKVTTSVVSVSTNASITATFGTATKTATLTIKPAVLTNISLSPTSVIGGTPSTGTATLSGPAATGGLLVSLSSSDSHATVPASVTVPAGTNAATFTVTTVAVSPSLQVTITGTQDANKATGNLTINAPTFKTLTLSPTSVTGGSSSTATATLDSVAPTGGIVLAVKSDNTSAQVPSSVTIPAGATSVTFTVTTSAVTTVTTANISATQGTNTPITAALTINLSGLASVTTTPASLVGGNSPNGTVTLNGPAPSGGTVVYLSSSSTTATVPASVTVAAGATSATFAIPTNGVDASTAVTITATLGTTSKTCTLTLLPAYVYTLTVAPTTVVGGSSTAVTGTVALNGKAGPSGTVVTLTSSLTSAATVPTSVTVAAGATKATFTVTTLAVTTNQTVTLSATNLAHTVTTTLAVTTSGLASVSTSPIQLVGGNSPTGTVTLNGPAPTGGAVVSLSSGATTVVVPASVTVAAGATTATFPITTGGVDASTGVVITATLNSASKTCTLTLLPAYVYSLTVAPTTVVGGSSTVVTGTVGLNGQAGPSGTIVTLSSSPTSAATVPTTVTVPAGTTKTTFAVTTLAVSASQSVTLTATVLTYSKTATLTVTPSGLSSVTTKPVSLVGGNSPTGTVTLNGPAPAGGAVVSLSSGASTVVVPASVTVAAGATTATFAITTGGVDASTAVTITASYGTDTKTCTLTLLPATLYGFTVAPTSVNAGTNATGTVNLNGRAGPSGVVVTLSSSPTSAATVPASVTVPSGATKATFTVTTLGVTAVTAVTLTATNGTTSMTATLTVNPSYQVSGVTASNTSITGGNSTTVTVSITSPAPAGGIIVSLLSTSSAVVVPATVTVPAGATSVSFSSTTTPVDSSTPASIQAWYGTKPTTPLAASVTVYPPTILAMVFSPSSVVAGSPTTLCVLLSGPAAPGATLTVTSSSTRLTVGSTLTCVGGQNFQTFILPTTAGAGTTVNVTITTKSGSSDSDVLTITP